VNTNKKGKAFKSSLFYSYFITDPAVYGDTPSILEKTLEKSFLNHPVDIVCFRDKETKDIKPLAESCLKTAKKHNIKKILINGDIKLALELGFDGVHLTSGQFNEISTAKENNLFTIISTHSEDEIKKARSLGANAVTYSPIFYKENKGKPKGCEKLKEMVSKYQNEKFFIIALGGIITQEQTEKVRQTDAKGFASIRYFKS
jgi:thiamine-phosphate pyrophosphorylase